MIFPNCEKLGQTIIFTATKEAARHLHSQMEQLGFKCTSIQVGTCLGNMHEGIAHMGSSSKGGVYWLEAFVVIFSLLVAVVVVVRGCCGGARVKILRKHGGIVAAPASLLLSLLTEAVVLRDLMYSQQIM
jgi:hypothetical protein